MADDDNNRIPGIDGNNDDAHNGEVKMTTNRGIEKGRQGQNQRASLPCLRPTSCRLDCGEQ